jgi:hypothetical protein
MSVCDPTALLIPTEVSHSHKSSDATTSGHALKASAHPRHRRLDRRKLLEGLVA